MTKSEFLDKLRAALGNDLSGAVIQENVNYYSSYISEEVGKGRAEADVIEELGDPWALAQTVIDSVEGKNTVDSGFGESYGYAGGQKTYDGQQEDSAAPYRTYGSGGVWWKRILVILGVIGVIMVVGAVIGGLVSLLAPFIVPCIIIVIVYRMFRKR